MQTDATPHRQVESATGICRARDRRDDQPWLYRPFTSQLVETQIVWIRDSTSGEKEPELAQLKAKVGAGAPGL